MRRLGDIGLFTILAESAVAAGVRRIEALTSEGARRLSGAAADKRVAAAAALAQDHACGIAGPRRARWWTSAAGWNANLPKPRRRLRLAGAAKAGGDATPRPSPASRLSCAFVEGVAAKDLKGLADDAKAKLGSGVVALLSTADGRASLDVGVTDDLTAKLSAVDLVRAGAAVLGGKGGGGRPDMAQAGGPDAGKAAEALTAVGALLR